MSRRGSVFQYTGAIKPQRSVFDLSHELKTTLNMGQIIPVCFMQAIPGDYFTLGNEVVMRLQPTIAPILHEVNVQTRYFFVPDRLLWGSLHAKENYPTEQGDFESFITGGKNNDFALPYPTWIPTLQTIEKYKMWDYFNLPLRVIPAADAPLDAPRRCYNFIWNEYFRDEDLQEKVSWSNENILYACWEKDYFTIARPSQQRGVAAALPLSGVGHVNFVGTQAPSNVTGTSSNSAIGVNPYTLETNAFLYQGLAAVTSVNPASANVVANLRNWLSQNNFDFSQAATFNVSDLRQVFQLQKWQERNMRAGIRYTEFLQSHFGVHPRDERLDRPEYIGGTKSPIIISEVLQTSHTVGDSPSGNATPQGTMAGHGLTVDRTRVGKYFVKEFGWIIGLLYVRPRTAYKDGIHRSLSRKSRYEWPFPEFTHLSEQAVLQKEVYAGTDTVANNKVYGFNGIYDELRYHFTRYSADMRDNLAFWHLGRNLPQNVALNADFVSMAGVRRDIFAVTTAVPNLILNYANYVKAVRPIPAIAEPGLVDHF